MAWWNFWKKQNPPNVSDMPPTNALSPESAAYLPFVALTKPDKPFTEWKAPGVQVPAAHESLIMLLVVGYQLFIYLKVIEAKFGAESARIIREHQLVMLKRLPEDLGRGLTFFLRVFERWEPTCPWRHVKIVGFPDVQVPDEWSLALYLLCLTEDAPYYIPPERRPRAPDGLWPNINLDGLGFALAKCLEHGRAAAIETFALFVRTFELEPEPIVGLRHSAPVRTVEPPRGPLAWSDNPGCYERQLQRRHENPLFSPDRRIVTQDEVEAAAVRDFLEADAFRAELKATLESISKGPVGTKVSDVTTILRRLDHLERRAAQIGGDLALQEEALANLDDRIMTELQQATSEENPFSDALRSLKEMRTTGTGRTLRNRFWAQMSREDSPIMATAEDILPSLLTEDPETIRLVMGAYNLESVKAQEIRQAALQIISEVEATGAMVPRADEKLEALGATRGPGSEHP